MNNYNLVGEYRYYNYCRFCLNATLTKVINLGYVPLAGGFLKKDFRNEKFYPLELALCENCLLLQSVVAIDKKTLFKKYFYFSSAIKTLSNYFEVISEGIKNNFTNPKDKFIVEIGSNDGILLEKLSKSGFKTLGVDPATNVVKSVKKNVNIINDFFTEKLSKKISKKYGKADVIVSFNTLAHIEDMHDVIKGIKHLLKKDGFLEFGVHYLGNLIKEKQYDMIYHEHQYYYSLLALINFLEIYDMEIFDVKRIRMHAGSIIFFVQNKKYGTRKIAENVMQLKNKEIEQGLDKIKTYSNFMKSIEKSKTDLIKIIKKLRKEKKRIVGYGASGRGTTIMNYAGLTSELLDCVIDDAPGKQGAYTPGNHLKIYPSNILYKKNKPDYVLLFAWSFFEEIENKHKEFINKGGKFIIPLPKVRIISH